MAEKTTEAPERPVISVVSGSPTEEELAALIAVLAARPAAAKTGPVSDRPRAGGWKSYWRVMRQDHRPGPGGWRAG